MIRCRKCGRWVQHGVIHTHDLKALRIHLWNKRRLIMNKPVEDYDRFFLEVVL